MTWQENAIVYFRDDDLNEFVKISDHNRAPLGITVERFESKNRMVNTTLRRYTVGKKRTFTLSWSMLPSLTTPGGNGMGTVDGGLGGSEIEDFHNRHDGAFRMKLRKGQDINKTAGNATIEEVVVMITDFSKDIEKRGPDVDFWTLNITLEEV